MCKGSGRWWGPLKCVSISRLQLKNPPFLLPFFTEKTQRDKRIGMCHPHQYHFERLPHCIQYSPSTHDPGLDFLRLFHLSFPKKGIPIVIQTNWQKKSFCVFSKIWKSLCFNALTLIRLDWTETFRPLHLYFQRM